MNPYLHTPVTPFAISPDDTAAELLDKMAHTAFQGRNLGLAACIWAQMLQDDTTIFFGLAGAMVPAGMRPVMVYLIENRMIDVLVSTGAQLFHDLHETLGNKHWQGSPDADDRELAQARINRMYDVFASEAEYIQMDEFITAFSAELDQSRPYTTREYFYLLGRKLEGVKKEEGVLTAAAKAGVPIYCPAFGDSVYGMAVAAGRVKGTNALQFDIVEDVIETARLVQAAKATGVIYIGGGTPKNFIQQAAICTYFLGEESRGHDYAVQITTDLPQWGGLSGCTFQEAKSWRKITPDAKMVTVHCDATIALPLLVSAVAGRAAAEIRRRKPPCFGLGQELSSPINLE